MIIINTVSTERFSVDGIEYFKNFTPVVAGDTLRLQNTYNDIHLFNSTNYANITVDGVVYGSVALLQSALLPVVYTRNTLGGGGGATQFIDLTDTPAAYLGNATKKAVVNATETGLEFVDDTGGGGTVFIKEGGGVPTVTDDKYTSANNGFGGMVTPENPIDVNGVIRKRGLGQSNGLEFDDQVIFALSSAGGGGHTTIQEKVDGQGTRVYLMPKGTAPSGNSLASGIKLFSTDYEADDVNYHDWGQWVTQNELISNSKRSGTFPVNLPFVWKYQDTNELMRIPSKNKGGLFLDVKTSFLKVWDTIFTPLQVSETTVILGREGTSTTEFINNAYYNSGWKKLRTGFSQRMSFDSLGNTVYWSAPSGAADAAVSWTKRFTIKNNTVNSPLPTYVDDTAAGVGGLLVNDMYKTATGEVRIKL